MQPKFLYFDLGKVLINFSVERMLDQVAGVAGITADAAREVLFAGGLMLRHETGRLSTREFYEAFCAAAGVRPDYGRLVAAAADIFELNLPMVPLAAQLQQAGYPMGILSNTCETHWEHCFRCYRIVSEGFSVYARQPPDRGVEAGSGHYGAAAELAGCRPEEIFFVDDIAGHVAGAQAVGFDAVQFTTAEALADQLRQRRSSVQLLA